MLGADDDVALIAGAAVGGGKGGSSDVDGEEMVLGAGVGEEWSGVPYVGFGGRCGESGRESTCSGVGKDASIGLGGSGDRAGRGGVCCGGRDTGCHPSLRPSAARPHSTS